MAAFAWRGQYAHPSWLGYAVALLALAAAVFNVWVLKTTSPVASFVLAVMAATWFGGTRPGLLTLAASVILLWSTMSSDYARLSYFAFIAGFLVWLIDSQGRASDALRHKERQLRLAVDTFPTFAWMLGADGKMEFINRQWLEYTGVSETSVLADPVGTVHPDDRAVALERWVDAQPEGKSYECEMRLRRADGEYRWFLVRTVPFRGPDGRIERWYGASFDIDDLKRAEDRLQQLSRRLVEVQEQERRHLARELHDEFGQLLAGVTMRLHVARQGDGEAARENLDASIDLLQRAGAQIRALVLELRPTILETTGLEGALRWLAEQHRGETGMATHVSGSAQVRRPEVAVACFRVAQEALTNAVRHARARNLWIELSGANGEVRMVVRDDGVGFDAARMLGEAVAHGHFGVLGMKERVELLGGRLELRSSAGEGTRIEAAFPDVP